MREHPVLMACGCVAQATTPDGGPACGVHFESRRAETVPDLSGRTAVCSYGHRPVPSALTLAFFEHRPHRDTDRYYCGCYGWD